ncbi:flagellar hook-length control protein FliK [Mycetocola sp.]|uniref:flagellar hook-length control protein FliK n=1 Tax=Mycetocola sp. TaxID=1871042 RepID=UPI003989C003
MTLISAPLASRPESTVAPASATAPPGAFALILQGVLKADASAGTPVEDDAATSDGLDAAASAGGLGLMSRPTGQPLPVVGGASGQNGTEGTGTTDADASVHASVTGTNTAVAVTAATASPAVTTGTAVPAVDAGTSTETTSPISQVTRPVHTPATPASPDAEDALPSTPAVQSTGLGTATETPATTPSSPIVDPATAASPPYALSPSAGSASGQNPNPAPATDANSQAPQPSTVVPAATPGTTVSDAHAASSTASGATPSPATGATVPAGQPPVAASYHAEAPTSVRAPALAGAQPSAAEPAAPVPVPAGSAPMPTAPTAPAVPSAPAPATPPAPAQPLTTQLARPLFSLAGARPGEHVMTVQVTPENLGPVTVRAVISAEDIRIELFSPSDGGREAIRQILTDLRRDLAGGGLSASLDLSSKDAQDSRDEWAPLRETPRNDATAAAPVPERRSAQPADNTTTLDITV